MQSAAAKILPDDDETQQNRASFHFSVAGSSAGVIEAVLQLFVFKSCIYSFRRIYVMTPSLEVKTSAFLPSSSTISYAPGVTVSAVGFMAI